MEIKVHLDKEIAVKGQEEEIKIIYFTGKAYGKYFNGEVICTGADTQKIKKDDSINLSARYILEGTDYKGNNCRIFIENNGQDLKHCIPYLVTDSKALSKLEKDKLCSKVIGIDDGVLVSIYREK